MGVASAITGGLGVGMGIYQTIAGAKEKRDAENALENYQRQELENVQKDRAVSTLGADLQREEAARLASGQISALQGGGTRALVGGLGRVEVGTQNVNQQIGANLDMQQKEIDAAIAQDDANIRSMQEARENADIEGLSSQYMSGKQDQNTGLGNIVMGAGMAANSIGAMNSSGAGSEGASGITTSGTATGPNTPMSSTNMRFAPQSGYANAPILTNPAYNPQNYGPQNAYGIFNQQYPYGNSYGPKQQVVGTSPTTQFGQFGRGMFAQPGIPQSGYYNR
jgi:hypothetical protein